MNDDKEPHDAAKEGGDWLRNFVMKAGPRLSADEARRIIFLAGMLNGTGQVMQELADARDAAHLMLDQLSRIVKGEPEPGCHWGFGDLPELVGALAQRAKGLH